MAEGYYEWKESGGRTKKPYYIKRKDGEIMFIAGLYDIWTKGTFQHRSVRSSGGMITLSCDSAEIASERSL